MPSDADMTYEAGLDRAFFLDQVKDMNADDLQEQAQRYLADTHWRSNDDPRRPERASLAAAYASLAVAKRLEELNLDATFEVFKTKANEEYKDLSTAEYDEHGNITSE